MDSQNLSQNDAKDIQDNKLMAVLAYLGILVLVPIFAAKDSKFAKFHANQGVILLICEMAFGIVYTILSIVLGAILISLGLGIVYTILIGLIGLCGLVFLVFTVLGIINAVNGKMTRLPIIGKYNILK